MQNNYKTLRNLCKGSLVLGMALITFACKKNENPSAGSVPTSMVYSVDTVSVTYGTAFTSVLPSIVGTQPVSYTLTTQPDAYGAISINQSGAIVASNNLAIGNYKISVVAKNSVGSTTFGNVFYLQVTKAIVAPTDFKYAVDTLVCYTGTGVTLADFIVNGSLPLQYTFVENSAGALVSIDNFSGKITADKALTEGLYYLQLKAFNVSGAVTTNLVLNVKSSSITQGPYNLYYLPTSIAVAHGKSFVSALPNIVLGSNQSVTYSLTSIPTTNDLSIDATTGKITVSSTAALTNYMAKVIAQNSLGITNVNLTINIVPGFEADIKPIMMKLCADCHNGVQRRTNYNLSSFVMADVDNILFRCQRSNGYRQNMPPVAYDTLTSDQVKLVQNWKNTGMMD